MTTGVLREPHGKRSKDIRHRKRAKDIAKEKNLAAALRRFLLGIDGSFLCINLGLSLCSSGLRLAPRPSS